MTRDDVAAGLRPLLELPVEHVLATHGGPFGPGRSGARALLAASCRSIEPDAEHQVTPLELFFDLTFVFAMTQVTAMLADDPTWRGVLRGMLVLAALWWGWSVYAWLTSATDVDEGGVRLVMLAAMGAMFGVALSVPGAFGDDALFFGAAYLLVRLLHLVLSVVVSRDDPDRRDAILRFAPTAVVGPTLIVLAGFFDGRARIALWLVALAIDYLGPVVIGVGRGWRVAPEHFAERHGLIVLIALGESIIAIGIGAGLELDAGVVVAAALGVVVVSALWWLYFDVAAIFARTRLMQAAGLELHRLALHGYSYLHLPLVAGVVLFALGLKTTVDHVGETLDTVPAVALCGGARAVSPRTRRVPLPDDEASLPEANDRRDPPAAPHPGCARHPRARGARARERGLLADRRLRGASLPRGPAARPASRAGRLTLGRLSRAARGTRARAA